MVENSSTDSRGLTSGDFQANFGVQNTSEVKPRAKFKKQVALEFENAAADVLIEKTLRAIDEYGASTVIVGGGVSANTHIRKELERRLNELGNPAKLLVPPQDLATDNAIMIALAGYFHALNKEFTDPKKLYASGNLKLA